MIAQIKMTNCQSWDGTTLNLATDKVNILRAPNNTGKSVLFKMLRVVAYPDYYNREKRKQLIRWGAAYAQIAFAFTSGAVCIVNVYPDKNIYLCRAPGETEFTSSLELPDLLREELSLVLGKKHKYIANIIDKEQELILVDSKAQDDYDLISLIAKSEELEAIKSRVPQQYSEFRSYTSMAVAKLNAIEHQLDQVHYVDVNAAANKLQSDELLFDTLYALVNLYDLLEVFKNRKVQSLDFDFLLEVAEFCSKVEELGAHASKCFVGTEPEDSTRIDTLIWLEQLLTSLPMVCTEEPVDLMPMVDALLGLESLLDSLREIKAPEAIPADALACVESLASLEKLRDSLSTLAQAEATKQESLANKESLQKELLDSGVVYQCPVHEGGVVFDGEICIPVSV